ncbi:MAG: methylmalonyl-CoA mutase, partial [Candidatus Cloacimonadota bacterium]
MYQRSKIQEESMHYEMMKLSGELPIMGVNTFISSKGSPTILPGEVIRATPEEKEYQINMLKELHETQKENVEVALQKLKKCASSNGNVFESMMEATKVCSIGQITNALFEVGGQYRRNM